MTSLRQRSYQAELMDGDNISFADMAQTLKELNLINTYLGGHAITLKGLNKIAGNKSPLSICEIGCGGGDNLAAIHKNYNTTGKLISYIGIDMNPECIAFARQQYPHLPCTWICSDYATVIFEKKPDIIFSSLFCHHFTNEALTAMLNWKNENSRLGFFVNDLQRHWLARYLIKYITKFFSQSYLIKNDAPLSVARSFKKKDWKILLKKAGYIM
jgi:2-polyprenyl-3-methyl-5-hydroxy-6-metoxy-1,4-benzoquinol methylase